MRARQSFTISVRAESRPNAPIGWGTDSQDPSTSIEVAGCPGICEFDQPSCPLGESGEWVPYPGGVWTVDAACISIEIVKDEETVIAQLPIGVECT